MEYDNPSNSETPLPGGGPPPLRPPPPVLRPRPGAAGKPRRSWGWKITSVILFCLLLASLFSQSVGRLFQTVLGGEMAADRTSGPRLEETVVEPSPSKNKIAVIAIEGIIMGESVDGSGYGMVEVVREQFKRAAEDDKVKAVLLKVDSPGGEVLASDDIYRVIEKFQTAHHKPVVVSMGSLAASGGYYVSAPCQWIVANEMTITGSIGVIMSTFNYRGLMDKIGLRPEVFKSGKYKDMLRGSKADSEITTEERDMIQNLINESYQRFRAIVGEGRDYARKQNQGADKAGQLAPNWAEYADGRILSGREAKRLGFVDELGNFQTAVARVKKLAGLGDAALVKYQQVYDLSHLLRLLGKSEDHTIKVNVGLDIPKIKTGQLYFLAPAFVH